jgi:hypothetical protein
MNGISALSEKFLWKSRKFFCKALKIRQWRIAWFVPGYSGGPVFDFNEVPFCCPFTDTWNYFFF